MLQSRFRKEIIIHKRFCAKTHANPVIEPNMIQKLFLTQPVLGQKFKRFDSFLKRRERYRPNYRIERYTNVVKELCVLLVRSEKVVTTTGRAHLLKVYASLVSMPITACRSSEPHPAAARSVHSQKRFYSESERGFGGPKKFVPFSR